MLMAVIRLMLLPNTDLSQNVNIVVTNTTGPQANYLDQGNWAISVTEPRQMEIKYSDHTHIKTL